MNRLITLITLFFLILASSCVTEDEPAAEALQPGDKCPKFSVKMNDGSIVASSDLIGERSIIVFFNTSCNDCRRELPQLQVVYDHIMTENLPIRLICISRAENAESIETFWKENNLTLPYSAQQDKTVYNLFASSVIPRIFILSPDLTITHSWDDNPCPSSQDILEGLNCL